MQDVELGYQRPDAEQMVAAAAPEQPVAEDKPKRTFLGMRGGGLIRTSRLHFSSALPSPKPCTTFPKPFREIYWPLEHSSAYQRARGCKLLTAHSSTRSIRCFDPGDSNRPLTWTRPNAQSTSAPASSAASAWRAAAMPLMTAAAVRWSQRKRMLCLPDHGSAKQGRTRARERGSREEWDAADRFRYDRDENFKRHASWFCWGCLPILCRVVERSPQAKHTREISVSTNLPDSNRFHFESS
nr:hypothetical protein CFP56_73871 [Quercus suber]